MTANSWVRQAFQSLVQFLIVFFTGMLVYDKVPTNLDQLWQPFVQAMLAALTIWAASKATVGNQPKTANATDNPPPEE